MRATYVLLFILALILAVRWVFFFKNRPQYRSGQDFVKKYRFLSEPRITNNSQIFTIDGIIVYASALPEFHYGDSVRISGILKERLSNKGNRLISQLYLVSPKIELEKQDKNIILSLIFVVRQKIEMSFASYLPNRHAGLLLGIVFGIREGIDKDFYTSLRKTGVLHVVAASGANVSMVGGFLAGLFGLLGTRRQYALFLTIAGIAFYALLSGLDPSIVRASLMAAFAYGAALFGRQNYSYLSLLLAAFIMLFITPLTLFDIGFQLSFFSTLGILFLKPLFDGIIVNVGVVKVITEDLTTTFSAQVATLPIMLSAFSSYSPMSLLANGLVLWTIPPLMILGGAAAVASLVIPFLAGPILFLSYPLLVFFEKTVWFFSKVAKPLNVQDFPILLAAGYYFILGAIVIYFKKSLKN